jgi:predicted nuclease with RNAse H fold
MTSLGPEIVGDIFRGNLRTILVSEKGPGLIAAILGKVGADAATDAHVTIAIDSPLAWPKAMVSLLGGDAVPDVPSEFEKNPYLFRAQERALFFKRRGPLSPVKDMIGSQSTKAIHFLIRSGVEERTPGIWSSDSVTAIEAYPSPSKKVKDVSASAERLLERYLKANMSRGTTWKNDSRDAIVCALVALLHREDPEQLIAPDRTAEPAEGWIWLPKKTAKIPGR